ncbi:MAG: efflux RND transporter periplasmic adaptor subunit [Gemmatimonadota bacterium]|nr:efflux RND transporter periplasmic adaptor subunit [Gemmatimonadota bacterium]MDE3215209.1 efflux RND transporter periplasmic adaptor subunit [Gemmatimonadota bacterium]
MSLPFPRAIAAALLLAAAAACGRSGDRTSAARPAPTPGTPYVVRDTTVATTLDAAGTAEPIAEATLSTKLMGAVTAVLVHEGDVVAAGQPLVHIDARDLAARDSQVQASIASARAVQRDADTQARRIRALFADSAATRAQLDAAETGLAQANAAVAAAQAGARELAATRAYADVRAPFAGVVTHRFVDPGAFAAPGAPLVTVQDDSRLRVSVNAAPDAVRGLRRGMRVAATIEDTTVNGVVEGVVPAAGNVYTVNAVVQNPGRRLAAGGAASIAIPQGARAALLVPAAAIRREGDLTGVTVREATGDELRWVRLGDARGALVEVTSGLRAGATIVVPPAAAAVTGGR